MLEVSMSALHFISTPISPATTKNEKIKMRKKNEKIFISFYANFSRYNKKCTCSSMQGVCEHVCMCACVHVCVPLCMHGRMHVCVHVSAMTHACVHVCMYGGMCECTQARVFVCLYHMPHTRTRTHARTHTHTHTQYNTRMCTHVYARTYPAPRLLI